ncbi:DUF2087 domain-containing protein [Kutzneria sp. NPDC052558]|uniref:DUF2087 domain-containing protein n=1 Tax=Kutzneria sp. NPDC052558 TaxID=3364121 RepID=UPI0037C9D7B0
MSAELSAAAAALQALSNPTRLAILAAVSDRNQRRVPVVLAELGFDMKILTKEIGRLTEAGLLATVRGQLVAELSPLAGLANAVVEATALARAIPRDSPLRRYLVRGRIQNLPKRPEDLDAMAAAVCTLLPEDRTLTEAEVNDRLAPVGDPAVLRRLLVDKHFVSRSASAEYRVIEHTIVV